MDFVATACPVIVGSDEVPGHALNKLGQIILGAFWQQPVTVIVNEQFETCPHISVAAYVIVVVPSLKELPEAKLLTKDTTLQLSETDGNVQFTCALQSIPGLTVIFVGQFRIVGEISSFKIMDCIHLDANIESNGSIAVQIRINDKAPAQGPLDNI